MIGIDFTKEPKEVVDYLAKKGLKPTFDYKEMMHEAHHTSFTVAKITNLDLLSDVHESLQSAFKDGKPFKQWKDELTPTLEKYGWLGNVTAISPETGEVKDIYVGSRRLKNIYTTNMRTAYNRINYKNLMEGDTEYWRYVSLLEGNRRPKHKAMHSIILPRTHPFWAKNKPQCAWGCQCRVDGYTKEELEAKGWKVSNGNFADIADDDWAYDKLEGAYKPEQSYFEKVKAFTCKESNAKIREVLCPFVEAIKEGYLADMLSLLPSAKEWSNFVDTALNPDIKQHAEMRLGYLSAIEPLRSWIKEAQPQSDLILADTGSIRNLRAKADTSKQGKVLEVKEIKALLGKIHTPDEIYLDEDVLLIYKGDKTNKIVIKIGYQDKNRIYNKLYSGQKYDEDGFKAVIKEAKKIL